MITILRTNSENPDSIKHVVVAYDDGEPSKGYTLIPNFGQYIGVDNSICFEKQLTAPDA